MTALSCCPRRRQLFGLNTHAFELSIEVPQADAELVGHRLPVGPSFRGNRSKLGDRGPVEGSLEAGAVTRVSVPGRVGTFARRRWSRHEWTR